MDTQVDTCCVFARLPLLLLLAGLSMVAAAAHADIGHLTIRVFDVDDGLPSWHVRRIVTDSKCFLWFCTPNGLTRFDGARFVSFGTCMTSSRTEKAATG